MVSSRNCSCESFASAPTAARNANTVISVSNQLRTRDNRARGEQELVARAQKLANCAAVPATDEASLTSHAVFASTAQAYEAFALVHMVDYLKRHGEGDKFASEDASGQR